MWYCYNHAEQTLPLYRSWNQSIPLPSSNDSTAGPFSHGLIHCPAQLRDAKRQTVDFGPWMHGAIVVFCSSIGARLPAKQVIHPKTGKAIYLFGLHPSVQEATPWPLLIQWMRDAGLRAGGAAADTGTLLAMATPALRVMLDPKPPKSLNALRALCNSPVTAGAARKRQKRWQLGMGFENGDQARFAVQAELQTLLNTLPTSILDLAENIYGSNEGLDLELIEQARTDLNEALKRFDPS